MAIRYDKLGATFLAFIRSQPCELGCDQFSPSPNTIVQCSEQYLFRDDRDRDVDIRGAARPD